MPPFIFTMLIPSTLCTGNGVSVSESPDFYSSIPVAFGRHWDGGRRWSSTVPKDTTYYIYVVAHPEVSYVLRVTLK